MLSRRALLVTPALLAGLPLAARAGASDWQPPVELARGKGLRGPWQQNDSRYDFVDDPAVALASDGSLVVAWVDQAAKAVLVQRRDPQGGAAGEPARVDRQPATFSWIPRVAIAPDDPRLVLALWQEIIFSGGSHGGEMMLARSTDGGRSFDAPRNLSSSRGGDGKGRITPSYWHNGSYDLRLLPGARVLAAWTEYHGQLWVARSSDAGRTFAPPLQVAGGSGSPPARAPSIAMAGDGAVLLAWTEGDKPHARIQVARSGANGDMAFERPRRVGALQAYCDAPRLAVDPRGTVHLAWAESPGGPFRRQHIAYARSRDAGRSFESPRAIAEQLPRPFAGAGFPSLDFDGRGQVVVLCELQEDVRDRPRGLGIVVSRDGGDSFGSTELVPGSRDPGGGFNGSSQGLLVPKLAVNARGEVAVVNSALREGSHSRVWLVRGRLG